MELWESHLKRTKQGPTLHNFTLKNGIPCVIAPMEDAPLSCLDIWVKAGSSFEAKGEEGLAHFLEHMVFKGSAHLAAGEFDLGIEALGGSSNAATGFDDVHFYVLVPPNELNNALELLSSLVLEPALHPKDYDMEREVVLEEIAQYKDQPDENVFQTLLTSCWPNHSYGRSILGLESSLKNSNSKSMNAFHKRIYNPKNFCLSIAGCIPNNIEESLYKSKLSSFMESSRSEELVDIHRLKFNKGHQHIRIPRLETSRILMAWELPSAQDQLTIMGADLATSILAEGRRSRLVQKLREELQIVEHVDMDLTILEQGSLIILEAYCLEENINKVEQAIKELLCHSTNSGIGDQEFNRARQLVINGLYFSLEAPSQVAHISGSQALWRRSQPLLEPLNLINYWTKEKIIEDILTVMQVENSFTLIASPNNKK